MDQRRQRSELWVTLAAMRAPPSPQGTEDERMRTWLCWAVSQFAAFEHMPWPADYGTVVEWRRAWFGAAVTLSATCRCLALFVSDFTGQDPRASKLRSDYTLHNAIMNADNGNREALCRIIRHPRMW